MPGTGAGGASYGDLLMTSLVVLGGVCVAAFLIVRFVGRFLATGRARGAHLLDVVARLPLEPRRSLYVVEVAGKTLLVGTSEMGISMLSELDAGEVRARLVARPSFGELVRAAWLRRGAAAAASSMRSERDAGDSAESTPQEPQAIGPRGRTQPPAEAQQELERGEPRRADEGTRGGAVESRRADEGTRGGAVESRRADEGTRGGAVESRRADEVTRGGAVESRRVDEVARGGAVESRRVDEVARGGAVGAAASSMRSERDARDSAESSLHEPQATGPRERPQPPVPPPGSAAPTSGSRPRAGDEVG